ncbi:WD40-repeat-containing domain protein [Lophiotrema nucula]|uniref:WD40-repeat-containing domain protein n=1 Tax=Lophiotrema nucula TaxID=690887 RepID=A0A6A5ZMS4_9PLEO|nr:WD40-repeat-containing domain protein [Lophiotrema nucula]
MEHVEASPQFKTTSLSVPSPAASHIACLNGARLQIRCLFSLEIVRSIPLPSSQDLRTSKLAWSPPATASYSTSTPPRKTPVARSNRILIADDETTRVYDLRDDKWQAVISNGSGGMGKNVHVGFGSSEDEVVVFSDLASKATIWCLRTGRTIEIKDPKYSGREGRGWGYRSVKGRGGLLAMLCRSAGQDTLMLMAPRTYAVIKRAELPTVDAQGIKWSRDGRWIAVWDAPSAGYNLHILTADGHLYRTIRRETATEYSEWSIEGLGIKTVEWVPGDEWLAVGGWDRRVRILSTRTFSPIVFLDHTAQVDIPTTPVYTEQVDGRGERTYAITQQPLTPPNATPEKNETIPKMGISIMAFNQDGTLCATRDDSTPTTVWIWDLRSLKPRTILIQHSPVKTLQWHPANPSQLLIQCTHDSPTVYLYTAQSLSGSSSSFTPGPPEILPLSEVITKPAGSLPVKWDMKWHATAQDRKPAFSFGHQQGYILVWPEGKDQILRFETQDGEESDDSLYDILTGRKPVPKLRESLLDPGSDEGDGDVGMDDFDAVEEQTYNESSGSFEDTFREKRKGASGTKGREKSVFDESGMSEMF